MSSRDTETIPPEPRQAVVLIHGIGEQRPMATLRDFVGALLDYQGDSPGDRYYSKPDRISDSYELRRIKLRRAGKDASSNGINLEWPETDFYEYYWAHHMYGTTASHVVRWLVATLRNSLPFIGTAGTAHPRLRRLAFGVWLLIPVVLGLIGTLLWFVPAGFWLWSPTEKAGAFALGLALLLTVTGYAMRQMLGAVLDVVGDAARYFDVNPKNVARRYDILRSGVALLRKLHEEREVRGDRVKYRYGRIVLIGHSLGSVIAYDILRHYWGEVNGRLAVDADTLKDVESFVGFQRTAPLPGMSALTRIRALRRALRAARIQVSTDTTAVAYVRSPKYWAAQNGLWKAISGRVQAGVTLSTRDLWRRHVSDRPFPVRELADQPAAEEEPPRDWQPARWLVSDLVTLGSPLAYAPVLVAAGAADLNKKLLLRELPTCPPDRSRHVNRGHFFVSLSTEADRFEDYPVLHHGACFAATRWTNLWYPNDPVGGPVRQFFGRGIRDVRLGDAQWLPLKSHVSYLRRWRAQQQSKSIQILKDILVGLCVRSI